MHLTCPPVLPGLPGCRIHGKPFHRKWLCEPTMSAWLPIGAALFSVELSDLHHQCLLDSVKVLPWPASSATPAQPFPQPHTKLHVCRVAAAEAWEESIKTPYSPLPDPGVCADLHSECDVWAKQGECTKNPGYMIGNMDGRGMCRKVRHTWPWQDSGRVV